MFCFGDWDWFPPPHWQHVYFHSPTLPFIVIDVVISFFGFELEFFCKKKFEASRSTRDMAKPLWLMAHGRVAKVSWFSKCQQPYYHTVHTLLRRRPFEFPWCLAHSARTKPKQNYFWTCRFFSENINDGKWEINKASSFSDVLFIVLHALNSRRFDSFDSPIKAIIKNRPNPIKT